MWGEEGFDTLEPMNKTSLQTGLLAAAVTLTGCASMTPCLKDLPGPQSRDGVTLTATRAVAADETCLQRYEWQAGAAPRGVVIAVHGLRDHALRYDALAEALTKRGFVVFGQDMRGHGLSGGVRQRWDSLDQLVADLDLEVTAVHQKYPGVPVFLYGHSLGGLLSTEYALAHPSSIDGLVLSGPALKFMPGVTDGQKSGARLFSAILPGLKVQELDDTVFVRTPEAKAELASDPLVVHDPLPARSAAATINAIDTLEARLPQLKLPFLVMHGTKDLATNIDGSKALAAVASSTDKTFKPWEGVSHDLLHEPEKEQVIATAVDWFSAHVAR